MRRGSGLDLRILPQSELQPIRYIIIVATGCYCIVYQNYKYFLSCMMDLRFYVFTNSLKVYF